jgi:hypothetical protein
VKAPAAVTERIPMGVLIGLLCAVAVVISLIVWIRGGLDHPGRADPQAHRNTIPPPPPGSWQGPF